MHSTGSGLERHPFLEPHLSKPFDRNTTPGVRTNFIEIQNVIDQIDKAIKDEQKLAPTAPIKRFDKDNPYSEEPPEGW